MKTTMKEIIEEAKTRKNEIAKLIKKDNGNRYVALYESDNGITLSTISEGHHTRNNQLSFADFDKRIFSSAIEQVEKEIADAEFYYLF